MFEGEARCDRDASIEVAVGSIEECAQSAAAGMRIEFSYKEGMCLYPWSPIHHWDQATGETIVEHQDCNLQYNQPTWNHYFVVGCNFKLNKLKNE